MGVPFLTDVVLAMSKRLSRRGLYEFLESEYAIIGHGARVLTIGSGGVINQLLAPHASRVGFEVVSFDIDPARSPDIVGDICHHDFGALRFDVVVMSEVLEHVQQPHLALANILKFLNPGGKLVLSTPFMLPMHDRPHDYYRFTRYGLEFLLREYQQVDVRERNSYLEAVDVLYARLLQSESRRARFLAHIMIPLVFIRQPLTRLLGRFAHTDAMTTGYVATARKAA